jgi:CheY-like chemotaxis protein
LLRHDQKTRNIPIHVISGAEDIEQLVAEGAATVSTKPVSAGELTRVFEEIRSTATRLRRNVLVADADPERRLSAVEAIRDGVTTVTAIERLAANADEISTAAYDAIIVGFGRSAKENAQTLDEIVTHLSQKQDRLVFFTPQPDAMTQLVALNPTLAGVPRAENSSQLGILISSVVPGERGNADDPKLQAPEIDLAGAKVLIVDDDIRNIYSLTSVLESFDIEVLHAERGRDGIELLQQTPDIDIALIDIMMPEMDGYETMRRIRQTAEIADIPLISVTAKAMKGDRQKCLDAGASDYIAKPVDLDLLLALLRVWISRARASHAIVEKTLASAG